MKPRPDLIVPIRDRRSRKRVLTLKNFGYAAIAIVVVFAAVTIQSDLRRSKGDSYGRLFSKQVSGQPDVVPKKVDIVTEAPVPDETSADPLLIAPAAREQYLGINSSNMPQPQPPPPQPIMSSSVITPQPLATAQGAVSIVGGPEGVTITKDQAKQRPTLSGGIFRQ
jgi:hypothetical protein